VKVYPNPSQGNISIALDMAKTEDVTVTITNALGSVVKTFTLQGVSNGVYPVDLSGEAKGAYEVSVKSGTNIITKRIAITE
jgi:hypothetical protein